jgi:hypothetical protein
VHPVPDAGAFAYGGAWVYYGGFVGFVHGRGSWLVVRCSLLEFRGSWFVVGCGK